MTTGEKAGYDSHVANRSNPHQVDKADVGLGNVDNTSDANKPVSDDTATAIGVVQSDLDTHKSQGDPGEQHVAVTQLAALAASNTPSGTNPYATTADLIAGGSGETNTASSQGTGNSIVLAKNIYDLPFKSIIGGYNISISDQAETITINQATSMITAHSQLTGIGTETHDNIDAHIGTDDIHIDWTTDQGAINIDPGNYIDTDTDDHTALSNIGSNTHPQIDSHISSVNPHIDWTVDQGATNIHSGNYINTTDHTQLSNIGSNSHVQIDSHIADGTVHFTESSISITESQISDLDNYIPSNQEAGVGTLLTNALQVTQAQYDGLTPNPTTMYLIVG